MVHSVGNNVFINSLSDGCAKPLNPATRTEFGSNPRYDIGLSSTITIVDKSMPNFAKLLCLYGSTYSSNFSTPTYLKYTLSHNLFATSKTIYSLFDNSCCN
eukprot:781729_1